jgi:hypothetical protein
MNRRLNALVSIGFALLLIWTVAVSTALLLAGSESYYKNTLRECGVYSSDNGDGTERRRIIYGIGGDMKVRATLSDAQLDTAVEHIIDFLFGDTESFELTLDGVKMTSGKTVDGVSLFGEKACSHMNDVKRLIGILGYSLIPSLAATVLLGIYIIKKVKPREAVRYTLCLLVGIFIFAALFCLWSLLGSNSETPFLLKLWGNLHYIIFAFQESAYEGSFLADALVYILTLDFFIDAVVKVLIAIGAALALWLTALILIAKRSEGSGASG